MQMLRLISINTRTTSAYSPCKRLTHWVAVLVRHGVAANHVGEMSRRVIDFRYVRRSTPSLAKR